MKVFRALTPEELARAERRLRHPAPGSRIEAAQELGIDLNLMIEQLRLTPGQRAIQLARRLELFRQMPSLPRPKPPTPEQELAELEALLEAQERE